MFNREEGYGSEDVNGTPQNTANDARMRYQTLTIIRLAQQPTRKMLRRPGIGTIFLFNIPQLATSRLRILLVSTWEASPILMAL